MSDYCDCWGQPDVAAMHKERDDLRAEVERLLADLRAAEHRHLGAEAEVERLTSELRATLAHRDQWRRVAQSAEAEVERLSAERVGTRAVAALAQQVSDAEAQAERLRAALAEARERLRTIEPRRQDADSVRRIDALLDGANQGLTCRQDS